MLSRFIDWLSAEPGAAVLLMAAAAAVFVSHFHLQAKSTAWDRRVLAAAWRAALLLALVWGFRQALNDGADAFQAIHGSPEGISTRAATALWGQPVRQRELEIYARREVEVTEQVPREDPEQPPVFRNVVYEQYVRQDIIRAFRGRVDLRLGEREQAGRRYSGYTADVALEYTVRGQGESEQELDFSLTMDSYPSGYTDLQIHMDGEPVRAQVTADPARATWTARLRPGQAALVEVHYTTSGTDSFQYQFRADRRIDDSLLVMTVDRLPPDQASYPRGVLAPDAIRASDDGRGSVLTWKLDRAAVYAMMGVGLPGAEPRGALALRALLRGPEAACLLAGLLAVTLLLWTGQARLADLAGFLAAFSLELLLLGVLSDLPWGFWGGFAAALALGLWLGWRWARALPTGSPRWLLLAGYALFAVLIPLSALWARAEQQNAFLVYLQGGVVLAACGVWFAARRRAAPRGEDTPGGEITPVGKGG